MRYSETSTWPLLAAACSAVSPHLFWSLISAPFASMRSSTCTNCSENGSLWYISITAHATSEKISYERNMRNKVPRRIAKRRGERPILSVRRSAFLKQQFAYRQMSLRRRTMQRRPSVFVPQPQIRFFVFA